MRSLRLLTLLAVIFLAACPPVPPSYLDVNVTVIPSTDPGRFAVQVNGVFPALDWQNLGNGFSTGATPVPVANDTLTVTGSDASTNIANYTVQWGAPCIQQAGSNNATIAIQMNTSPTCTLTLTHVVPPPPVPTFSPASTPTTTACPYNVTLSDTDPNATIHVTTDGSQPSASSPPFTGPIAVNSPLTIKAIAIDPAKGSSAVAGQSYLCPEPVVCNVFDDGYTNMEGPSNAIFHSGRKATSSHPDERGMACIPNGQFGHCHKWFGRCQTVNTHRPVTFQVFNDGSSSPTAQSDAVYIPKDGNQACIPDQTSTGTCRRWFGNAMTGDGHPVSCAVFDDGNANQTGTSGAIYVPHPIPAPGEACIPDNTSTGTCRRWWGACIAAP